MTVTIVVAVAANGVIGQAGDMPWHLPEDLANFKRLTSGHVLVMGRVTYESIGRLLPGRTTIVVTRDHDWAADGALVAHSVDDALRRAAEIDDEVFVAGGAAIYLAALAIADRMVWTAVHAEPEGDTFFPEVDWSEWALESEQPHDGFTIRTYDRIRTAR